MAAHVAVIADKNYTHGLAVTLKSLLDHCSSRGLDVWIINCGLQPCTWDKLQLTVDSHNSAKAEQQPLHPAATLHRLQTITGGYQLPPCSSYAGQCSWLKLLLPQLLPARIDLVLYLDCDTLVRGDLYELFDDAIFKVRLVQHANSLTATVGATGGAYSLSTARAARAITAF